MKNTTLCYIENPAGEYLMLHRVKKENDCNHDKWIGVGFCSPRNSHSQNAYKSGAKNKYFPFTLSRPPLACLTKLFLVCFRISRLYESLNNSG